MGDFNRDGRMDVAVANSGSNNVSILLGDGAGGFTPGPAPRSHRRRANPVDIAAGDLDRDGILDLVVAFGCGPPGARSCGAWRQRRRQFTASGPSRSTPSPTRIYLADLTSDADLDLVGLAEAPRSGCCCYGGRAGITFDPAPCRTSTLDRRRASPPARRSSTSTATGGSDLAVAMRNRELGQGLLRATVPAGLGRRGPSA